MELLMLQEKIMLFKRVNGKCREYKLNLNEETILCLLDKSGMY
ncbi:hypothetical protein ES708_16342 [subsurface metagenome]